MASPTALHPVLLPESYNYIGVFLTFRCPYNCSYCINHFHANAMQSYRECSGAQWLQFFKRLTPRDVPITLQGGEPGVHPDFIELVQQTCAFHPVDILTNLAFDLDAFIRAVDPALINRTAPYAPIRVSYHPEQFSLETITRRVLKLMDAGFRVGLYGVTHPEQLEQIEQAKIHCRKEGIDFRTKPFLGFHNGKLYGEYAYPDAFDGGTRECECAPSELLLAPDGGIHRCHYFCYQQNEPLAHIQDSTVALPSSFLPCSFYGQCNPCDVKIKNNRFQQFGHISTRIRHIAPAHTSG